MLVFEAFSIVTLVNWTDERHSNQQTTTAWAEQKGQRYPIVMQRVICADVANGKA